jgi:hypothetical protein
MRVCAVLIPLLCWAGCGTYDNPKDYQPPAGSSDTGQVYLYRIAPRSTPGVWPYFNLDGRWSAQIIPRQGYFREIHAGRHVVRVESKKDKLEFTVEKDQTVFIRFDVDSAFSGRGIYPVLVDRATAREELKSLGCDIDHPTKVP